MRRVARRLSLALVLTTPMASANGRIPNAGLVVVGPGARASVVAVQLTFGVALSTDAGRSSRYVCEEAYSLPSGWDPPIAIGHDGAIHLGLLDGLRSSMDGCAWAAPPGIGSAVVLDLAHDATGRHVVAGVGAPDAPNGVMASDDGGRTLRVATRTFDGNDAWLSAVDPTDPDVVYVRSTFGLESRILRSTDGGASFTRIATLEAGLTGFALSDDGGTVWLASGDPAVGIQRSVRGGPFTRTRANATVRCMRYHAGVLYVCGTEATDGWALACSDDGGDTLRPLLAMRAIAGPVVCPSGTPVRDRCEALWPVQLRMLVLPDAGAPTTPRPHDDAGADVGLADILDAADVATTVDLADALDLPITDGPPRPRDVAPDAPSPPPARQCGCRAGRVDGALGAVWAALLAAWTLRRPRRRPSAR